MRLPRWRHGTVRARLVVMVAVLAAVALVAANTAGLVLLRRTLTDRVDEQLTSMSRMMARGPGPATGQQQQRFVPREENPSTRVGGDQIFFYFGADGELEERRDSYEGVSPPALEPFDQLVQRAGERAFTTASEDGKESWRVLVVSRLDPANLGGVVVVATSLAQVDATAELLLAIDVGVTLLVLLLLALGAAAVVRIGLRPLTRMERTATEITANDLSQRLDDTDPHTEPGRLGIALNKMLDQIEAEIAARTASERRLRQFVADASHELRTPLTSIRGFAELYRRGGAPPGPLLEETMSRIESEAARMGLLVEDLLLLARLDLQRPPKSEPVDLLAIAADTIRDAHARVPLRRVRLETLGADGGAFEPVSVFGDEHRLRQVATNLVANALQHTPDQADITVRVGRLLANQCAPAPVAAVGGVLSATMPVAVLEVADTGPGISGEHAERIFERLYRADASRARRNGGGSGLGLSIVAAIVSGHGGRVELATVPGQGAAFRVLLPAGSQPALS